MVRHTDTSVCDHHVNRTKLRANAIRGSFDCLGIAHVRGNGDCRSVSRLNLRDNLAQQIFPPRDQTQTPTTRRDLQRQTFTDPG
jgi:hypothetical protein